MCTKQSFFSPIAAAIGAKHGLYKQVPTAEGIAYPIHSSDPLVNFMYARANPVAAPTQSLLQPKNQVGAPSGGSLFTRR